MVKNIAWKSTCTDPEYENCYWRFPALRERARSSGDLYVDGDVEGTIELQEHRLTVGPNGKVCSNIKARDVVISGLCDF